MMKDEWREVPGFQLYEVSRDGRIRTRSHTYQRVSRKGRIYLVEWKGRELHAYMKRSLSGRPSTAVVNLRRGGNTHTKRVARAVLEAFVGPCPEEMEACHNDGNPANNVLENLRWDTHIGNCVDMAKHGTRSKPPLHRGETHHNATISNADVRRIRGETIVRGTMARLARQFSVAPTTIKRIVDGLSRA